MAGEPVSVLVHLAHVAATQPATKGPGPGEFLYLKSEGWQANFVGGGSSGVLATSFRPFTQEMWISPDGSGRSYEVDKHLLFPSAADAAFYKQDENLSSVVDAHTSDTTFKPGQNRYIDLSSVPTDPAKLEQVLRTVDPSPPGNAQTFQIIRDLMSQTYAPPAVRSALIMILARLPGVQILGLAHDQLGRSGIGVADYLPGAPNGPVDKDVRDELILDRQTGALLSDQWVVVHKSKSTPYPRGSVIGWTAYLASGVVNSTTATTWATP